MKSVFTFLFLSFSISILAQERVDQVSDSTDFPDVIQFSGVLVTGDSLFPVPYSNVYRTRDNTGVISNVLGFFTLPVFEGDTVMFSNVGYRNTTYVIPNNIEDKMLSIVQLMAPDTIRLADTEVYPWPSRENFKADFLALALPDDNLARIQRNLDPLEMKKRMEYLGPEAASAASFAMKSEALRLQSMGAAQNISLLNPFAWAQFLSAIKNGDLRRK